MADFKNSLSLNGIAVEPGYPALSGLTTGHFLKASGASAAAFSALSSGEITTALGYTPVNKAGDTMTGALILPAGSASAPSLAVGESDVGLFRPGANILGFATAGTEWARMLSNGHLGIGISPSSRFHMAESASLDLYVESAGTGRPGIIGRRSRGDLTTQSGVVANDILLFFAGTGYHSGGGYGSNVAAVLLFADETHTSTSQASYMTFGTTPTGSTTRAERVRITQLGSVAINKTSSIVGTLHVAALTSATIGLNIQGAASQTSDLFQARDSSANVLALISAGGGFVFNENAADVDCRIEGDTNANLFFTDASTDRVGIGTNAPNSLLDVAGALQCDSLRVDVTPTAETPAMTHTFTISLNGTNYKVPVVAA